MSKLTGVIAASDLETRNRSLDALCQGATLEELLEECAALAELARHEQYLAVEETGRRYDIGARYGLLTAQVAMALNGRDRSQVLSNLLELLADREMASE